MNNLVVKNVPFYGTELLAVQEKETGKIYAGINLVLTGLGFNEHQTRYRREKWMEDKSLSKGVRKFSHPSDKGGVQEAYCIDIMKLPLALAKWEITPKMERDMPALSERLEAYQDRCADVLAAAFLSKAKKQNNLSHLERLASVNNAVKILTPMLKAAGCNSKIQLLTAKQLYEKAQVFLPIEIGADKRYWDTVHIARQVGIYYKASGKPADKAVNEIIRRIGVTEEDYADTWESKGKWQGTVRKYSDEVIERVRCWLADNDYPMNILYQQSDGQWKAYHVTYKLKEEA